MQLFQLLELICWRECRRMGLLSDEEMRAVEHRAREFEGAAGSFPL